MNTDFLPTQRSGLVLDGDWINYINNAYQWEKKWIKSNLDYELVDYRIRNRQFPKYGKRIYKRARVRHKITKTFLYPIDKLYSCLPLREKISQETKDEIFVYLKIDKLSPIDIRKVMMRRGEKVSLALISMINTGKIFVNKPVIPKIIENQKPKDNVIKITMDQTCINIRTKKRKVEKCTATVTSTSSDNKDRRLMVYLEIDSQRPKYNHKRGSTNVLYKKIRKNNNEQFRKEFDNWMKKIWGSGAGYNFLGFSDAAQNMQTFLQRLTNKLKLILDGFHLVRMFRYVGRKWLYKENRVICGIDETLNGYISTSMVWLDTMNTTNGDRLACYLKNQKEVIKNYKNLKHTESSESAVAQFKRLTNYGCQTLSLESLRSLCEYNGIEFIVASEIKL